MGADNHPTTVPGNSETHSVDDAVEVLKESDAYERASYSNVDTADVHAVLVEGYDTANHTPEWFTIENVYTSNGMTGIWLTIDE